MLAKRVIEWTEQWKAEGLQQGLQQGRQGALEAERSLLVRLARRRFDDASAQALSVLLVDVMDLESLAEIGEWIVVCDSGEDLLARLRAR